MTDLEKFRLLLAEVGPAFDEIQQIDIVTDDTWVVVLDEDTFVEVHCDVTGRKLAFTMPLTSVDSEQRTRFYELLLSYNFLKRDTGGFHLAIDGDGGNVYLMLDVHHADMDADTLIAVLQMVCETGDNWRRVLSSDTWSSNESTDHIADLVGGAIRV